MRAVRRAALLPGMTSTPRGRRAPARPQPARALLVGALALVLASSCLAPRSPRRSEEEGSLAEFAELLEAQGAQPVDRTETAGLGPPDREAMPVPEGEELPLIDAEGVLAQEAPGPELDEPLEFEESPYLLFGERIILREVGGRTFVTKPYALPIGRPGKITQLLAALQPFPFRQRPQPNAEGQVPALDPEVLEYQILPGFDDESYTVFPSFDDAPKPPTTVQVSDVLVVTAVPALLSHFEEFLDLFAGGGVPQIELEAKIIEILETNSEDYGGNLDALFGSNNFVRSLEINLPNISTGTEALLSLAAIQDQVDFNAVVEAIKGWQNVSIEARPKTVVRAGGVARIETLVEIPFLTFKALDTAGNFSTSTEYKKVGTSLWISPRVVGSNRLSLDVLVETSQRVGSQAIVAVGGSTSEVPTIALRSAKTVVHLKPGQTLLVGGLTQERDQEIHSKVPILGDIPLLGFFFRSTFSQRERQTVIFAISARVIQQGDFETEL